MKFSITRAGLVPVLLVAALSGCAHDGSDPVDLATVAASYQVVDGVVAFQDQAAFHQLMAQFKEEGDSFERNVQYLASLPAQQFAPLAPVYAYEDDAAIKAYADKKLNTLAASNPHLTTTELAALEVDDEDTIIADPHFASLLNANRELVIGSTFYKYTVYGVFMGAKSVAAKVRTAASTFRPNPRKYNKEAHYNLGGGVGYFPQEFAAKTQTVSAPVPVAAARTLTTARVAAVPACPITARAAPARIAPVDAQQARIAPIDDCGGGGGGGTGGGSTGGGSSGPPAMPATDTLPLCSGMKKSLWNTIFGPSTVCTQKWSSTKRLKTKVWNQNYFVYSSIGISVRSQSRKLRIWWAKKTDELLLGYNTITFDYPWSVNAINPNMFQNGGEVYSYKGQTVNSYWTGGGKLWNTAQFPIGTVNNNWLEVQIYLPLYNDNIGYSVSTKDINNYAESKLRSAINSFIRKQTKPDEKTPTVITAMTQDKARYIHHNWKKHRTNENKIIEVFDWNTAQISVSFNPGSGSGASPDVKKTAKSYELILADVYGVGRRGNTWKGSRVEYLEN
jgi:hypothetical protein